MDTSLVTLLTSAGGGGLFGVLTKGLSAIINFKQAKINHAHELQLRRLDIEEAKIEAEGVKFETQVKAETDREVAVYKSTESARDHSIQRWSTDFSSKGLVRLDILRGSVRPVIIYYLAALATTMWFTQPTDDIRGVLVHAVVAWLSGALAFYYGGREYTPPPTPARLGPPAKLGPLAQSFAKKFPNGIPGFGPIKRK